MAEMTQKRYVVCFIWILFLNDTKKNDIKNVVFLETAQTDMI